MSPQSCLQIEQGCGFSNVVALQACAHAVERTHQIFASHISAVPYFLFVADADIGSSIYLQNGLLLHPLRESGYRAAIAKAQPGLIESLDSFPTARGR